MYFERILHVDLSQGKSRVEGWDARRIQPYLGGVGLGTRLLYDHLRPGADPLSPENVLVFAAGPFAGTLVATGNKHAVVAKSPLTGMIGDSLSGSFWSHTLRRAGYDALVITGRAAELSYLIIHDDQVRLCPASRLAGLDTWATEDALRGELGSDEFSIAAIGPAGERLVRFALIANDRTRMAGRTGLGAVMGAKNLKAIAVRGSKTIRIADMATLEPLAMDLARRCQGPMTEKYRGLGTPSNVLVFDYLRTLPTRNYRQTTFEGAEKVSGEALNRRYVERVVACAGCPVACEHVAVVREGPFAGARSRMDYEPLYAVTSLWGVDDLRPAIRAVELAGLAGMDAISAGTVVAWAMECFENGILTRADCDGLEPYFGNAEAGIALLEKIVRREGIGDLLAEGTRRAAAQVGRGSEAFAMHVKGLEMAGYDPRGLKTMALGYAVGTRGACHNRAPGYNADIQGRVDRFIGGPDHGTALVALEDRAALFDALGLCKFIRAVFGDFYAEVGRLYRAVTGLEMTPEMLEQAGARICNLKRAFNLREGWVAADDWLPPRALADPVPAGPNREPLVVTEAELRAMIAGYYAARGWTADGMIPKRQLIALGLEDVAADVGVDQP